MAERPYIKVCGLTRKEDVRLAVDAGARALGFVHYKPSPRHLALGSLANLVAACDESVDRVLVLVDAPPLEAVGWAQGLGVSHLQLCGEERPEDWSNLPDGLRLLRRIAVTAGARAELEAWAPLVEYMILDHPFSPGGTGLPVDDALARELCALAPCVLAGGLDGGNVAARVQVVRPAGVDASSLLESAPGVKDPERVRAYVSAAHEALLEEVRP